MKMQSEANGAFSHKQKEKGNVLMNGKDKENGPRRELNPGQHSNALTTTLAGQLRDNAFIRVELDVANK